MKRKFLTNEDSSDNISITPDLGNLGNLYKELGRYSEAEELINKAIEIKQKRLGANHPDLALDIGNLGLVQYEQGRLVQAEKLYL